MLGAESEAQLAFGIAAPAVQYALPKISDGTACIDNTWTASSLTTQFNDAHLAHLSAEDSGRYSFGAQKISAHSCAPAALQPASCVALAISGESEPPGIAGWREGGFVVSRS